MFFALSLLIAFIVLYFMIYAKSDSKISSFETSEVGTKIENDILEHSLGFDTLLMPDELYIFTKKKAVK